MANREHLEILGQGVDVWNKWRDENSDIRPDLTEVDFKGIRFKQINLSSTELGLSSFEKADLQGANFAYADLTYVNLIDANLYGARFWKTDFDRVDLSGASFLRSRINQSVFNRCSFKKTNFRALIFAHNVFADCDLSGAEGLLDINMGSPSTVGIDTIYKSGGKIPEAFLRGCGVPEDFITYAKSLVTNPIDFYSCFISFTEKDDAFSERLYNDMQAKGVRCWRWKEDAKWGRTLRKEIDEAVRYYDKLVVICSKESLNSPAVLEEIERALDKEDALKRKGDEGEVLFPIRIDNFIFDEWESELKVRLTKKNIGDFRDWNSDPEKYRKSVERLVKDLNRPRK